eukprot:5191167-Prymnesium_polylepis.1
MADSWTCSSDDTASPLTGADAEPDASAAASVVSCFPLVGLPFLLVLDRRLNIDLAALRPRLKLLLRVVALAPLASGIAAGAAALGDGPGGSARMHCARGPDGRLVGKLAAWTVRR